MERVVEAAKIANAHEFISSMPLGYETQVGDRGDLLSGGQKQRIAIARAIISDPKILLLDEATAALDSESERLVQEAVERASRGRTTLIIAHRLSTIKQADNIIVLTDGRLLEQGTYSGLIGQDGMFKRLVQVQELNTQSKSLSDQIEKQNTSTTTSKRPPSHNSNLPVGSKSEISAKKPTMKDEKSSSSLLRFMWSLNRADKWFIVFGVLSSILSGANQPVRGILFGHSIMALSLPMNQSAKIRHDSNFWSGMFLMLAGVQLFALSAQGTFFGLSSERLVRRAQRLALRSILRQDMSFFDRPENSPGKLSTLLSNDASSLAGFSGATIGAIIVFLTTVFGSIAIALGYGWKLALVCMSIMPILIACGFLRFWVLQKYDDRAQRTTEAAGFASEATSAIRTVASLTLEDTVMKNYRALLVRDAFGSIRFILKSSAAYAFSQAIMFAGCSLGFWYGGNLIANGEYTVLAFFICFTETLFGAQAAGNIVSFAPEIGTGKGAAKSFRDLIDNQPEIDIWSPSGENAGNIKGSIEFSDIYFQYPQRPLDTVLTGLSFTVKEGQFIALVGASGSGKSTTLELIERFYNPSSGSISLDGKLISDFNLRQYRSQIALVRQDTALYTGTIKDNLCLGHQGMMDNQTLEMACKSANIYDFIVCLHYLLTKNTH
jgi:ATP-binding cassette, subfamily B (MDR/TAP), member 1